MTKFDPWDIIPSDILAFWRLKYGAYLMASQSADFIIFYENGTLNSFHPSGDRLARHDIKSGNTLYICNKTNFITENEYRANNLLND